jgi:hypothetical protein
MPATLDCGDGATAARSSRMDLAHPFRCVGRNDHRSELV